MRRYVAALSVLAAGCAPGVIGPRPTYAVLVKPSMDGDFVFSRHLDYAVESVWGNHSTRAVWFAMPSFSTILERRDGDEWVPQRGWYGITADGPNPVPVQPGAYRSLAELPLGQSPDVAPGTYRIRVLAYEDAGWTRPIPDDERVSRPFTVVG